MEVATSAQDQLRLKLNLAETNATQLQDALSRATAERDELRNTLESSDMELARLRQVSSVAHTSSTSLTAELEAASVERDAAVAARAALREEEARLRKALVEAEAQSDKLKVTKHRTSSLPDCLLTPPLLLLPSYASWI